MVLKLLELDVAGSKKRCIQRDLWPQKIIGGSFQLVMVFAIMPLIPSIREASFSPGPGFLLSCHGGSIASVRYRFALWSLGLSRRGVAASLPCAGAWIQLEGVYLFWRWVATVL